MAASRDPAPITPEQERRLAATLFNRTWDLMDAPERDRAADDAMLHLAHASRHHWGQVGEPVHLARGEWLCSRVYAVLGRPEPARHHAERVLSLCEEHGIGDWDLAFAHEALARAALVAGDVDEARAQVVAARAVEIAEAEDREQLESDLADLDARLS